MRKDEITLLLRSIPIVDKGIKYFSREQRKRQDRQKLEVIASEIEKIESKATAEIQIIREKSAARMKSKLLILEELKLRYKIKHGVK